jgi:short-subunit dehydrogenase
VISSVAGTKGMGSAPSYSATKRLDWTYIEALAQLAHMQKLDIKFTDIRPGFVATDFIAGESYPMTMQTDYVVKHILKAVRKGKRKVIIDWKYRIMCFNWRHIPSCVWERLRIHN